MWCKQFTTTLQNDLACHLAVCRPLRLLQCIGLRDSGELNPPISDRTVVVDGGHMLMLSKVFLHYKCMWSKQLTTTLQNDLACHLAVCRPLRLLQCIGCCDSGELNSPISDRTVVVDGDEISFFNVKILTSRHDVPYGEVSIVFSGDFHQLQPICESDKILYSCSSGALACENSVNYAIFLENNHRFKDDPEYGAILGRMRMGKDTKEDREKINTMVIGKCGVQVPDVPDPSYACPTNKERNGISARVFKNHIIATHPLITSNELPPDHTLMIEASIRTKHKKVSQAVHDVITTMLGDNDIKVSKYNRSLAKIDPLVQVFPGSQEMCISNDDIKKGR